jgi:carbon-monoxide dehydrogenase large subunit/6-hydroxypseudooxynicotine dehydrogenase subunit gamma
VVAAWTAVDVLDIPPIDFREGRIEQYEPYRQPILAKDYVRYVGEPIATVFADSPYSAEDAADLVKVNVEELPAILSPVEVPDDFAPGRSTEVVII